MRLWYYLHYALVRYDRRTMQETTAGRGVKIINMIIYFLSSLILSAGLLIPQLVRVHPAALLAILSPPTELTTTSAGPVWKMQPNRTSVPPPQAGRQTNKNPTANFVSWSNQNLICCNFPTWRLKHFKKNKNKQVGQFLSSTCFTKTLGLKKKKPTVRLFSYSLSVN